MINKFKIKIRNMLKNCVSRILLKIFIYWNERTIKCFISVFKKGIFYVSVHWRWARDIHPPCPPGLYTIVHNSLLLIILFI